MQITLPSGFSGNARKLKAADLQSLADQMDDDDLTDSDISTICYGAWQETTNTGEYRSIGTGDIRPPWRKMLKGDLMGLLFQVRVGSFRYGHEYDFVFPCERCDKPVDWTIDLRAVVLDRMKPLPESSYPHLSEGRPLEMRMHDQTLVQFRLQTIDSEEPFHKLRRQQVAKGERKSLTVNALDQVAMQIVRVYHPPTQTSEQLALDGSPRGKENDFFGNHARVWNWVHDLDLDDLYDLQAAFEEADCGYQTDVKVRCTHEGCRWTQTTNVPLQKRFLVPTRRSRAKKTTEETPPSTGSSSSSSSHGPQTETGSGSVSTTSAGSSTAEVGTASPDSVSST